VATLKLTATLTTDGAPLSNKEIYFYYSYDKVSWILIGSQATNESGQASVTHATDKTTYYKAEFKGDPDYEPSSAIATYVVPTPTQVITSSLMSLIPLMLMLALLGAVIRLIRKK
jgi:hypothetical protein